MMASSFGSSSLVIANVECSILLIKLCCRCAMANCNGFEIGFKNPKDAVLSTLEGIEFFMRNEVTPKFDNWAVEPLSWFGKNRSKALPLEYFIELYAGYYDLKRKYGLPWPQGLGRRVQASV